MVKKYKTKPCVIEAIQFTKDTVNEILVWTNGDATVHHEVIFNTPHKDLYYYHLKAHSGIDEDVIFLVINTLEGPMKASLGDYIIKGLRGEFYPCKPDVFHKKYLELKEEDI